MELRSYNVERVYKDCVICRIGDDIGIRKASIEEHREDIVSMLQQVATYNGWSLLAMCNIRTDGEIWTPYLQIVEMLIRLGKKIDMVAYDGPLSKMTKIVFKK